MGDETQAKGKDEKKDEKKEEKKGNWETIGYTPVNYEVYPCVHRWNEAHPREPCPKYKNIRYIVLPLSDRIKSLAMPLLRRLLALWLEFGDKMSPEMRARLLKFLCDNYGLTPEFLEKLLEAKRAEEEKQRRKREKKKKGKKKRKRRKRRKRRRKGKKRKKKGKKGKKGGKKKKKEKGKKEKKPKEKKEEEETLKYKKRKAGKLPLDWPYKMGSQFLLKCIAYLSQDPDEDFSSRATEYFDVQAMAILEFVCDYLEMQLPDPDNPSQYGETLVIMALNLSHWIAKYVTKVAHEIPDDKVDDYLALKGGRPKTPKAKKEKKEKKEAKEKKEKKDKKGKKDKKDKKEQKSKPETPEPVTEVQRNWEESKSPVYVPIKTRITKRKKDYEEEDQWTDVEDSDYPTESEADEVGVPRWKDFTLDEVKQEFLEYTNWYDPWEPEWMYLGPKVTPTGMELFKIWDQDTDDVPEDLRVLNWTWPEKGFLENYSFIPSPVPPYYPTLRPLRPIRLEDLERSGIPKDIIKHDLRFFSPWYLTKECLKPTEPESAQIQEEEGEQEGEAEMEGEKEIAREREGEGGEREREGEEGLRDEIIIDAMFQMKSTAVKDSVWADAKMKEQIEIIGHLLHLCSSVPDLTLEHVFEILEEFLEAASLAELDENPSEQNRLLIKKRTIVLERYFVDFFGIKFRDYNKRTYQYIRTLCSRCAYYIQLLYDHTAKILWELQSRANPPSPVGTPPGSADDPQALQDWDEWLAWLIMVTETCDEWAKWISNTVDEAERKAEKQKGDFIGPDGKPVPLTKEEWIEWKTSVEDSVYRYRSAKRTITGQSPYYLERAQNLKRVKNRPVKKPELIEEEEEGEWEWEEEEEEEERVKELVEDVKIIPEVKLEPVEVKAEPVAEPAEPVSEDETEWEETQGDP